MIVNEYYVNKCIYAKIRRGKIKSGAYPERLSKIWKIPNPGAETASLSFLPKGVWSKSPSYFFNVFTYLHRHLDKCI